MPKDDTLTIRAAGVDLGRENAEPTMYVDARELRMLIWAAKCHVHAQTTGMRLGALVHSVAEVQQAIDALDVGALKLEPASDEGVKGRNYIR